jgi:peptidoglycan hydrolase-like protein with peptidoglycan-binding domain
MKKVLLMAATAFVLCLSIFLLPMPSIRAEAHSEDPSTAPEWFEAVPIEEITGNTDVLILQDVYTWGMSVSPDAAACEDLGISYDLVTSTNFATMPLSTLLQYKAVILMSDQPKSFYDNLYAHRQKIADYVSDGGVLSAVIYHGWNDYIVTQQFLPGGVTLNYERTEDVDFSPTHYLISNPDRPVSLMGPWGYNTIIDNIETASTFYFTNLPSVAVTIAQGGHGHDVMLEYPFGDGRVVAVGIPIQWFYRYELGLGGNGCEAPWDGANNLKLLYNELRWACRHAPSLEWVRVTSQTGAYICSDSTGYSFPLLEKGDTGPAVRYLQVTLNSNPQTQVASTGPGSPLEETVSYGELTENAVKRFQELRNLEKNGRVDSATRDALNSMPLPVKHVPNGWVLRIVDTHGDSRIRDGTVWWEVEDVTDGVRGWVPREYVAIEAQDELQQQVKLILRWTDDAPVIPHDFQFERDLPFSETSDDVKYLQMILKAEVNETVYPASINATGFYGAITKDAVLEFQTKYGLPQNGDLVGEETRNKLNEFLRNGKYELNQTRVSVVREAITSYIIDYLPSGFPVYIVLAIPMVETGLSNYDNTVIGLSAADWGRGIMQIDTDTNVGAASGLRWFENGLIHYGRHSRDITRHYYTNTVQGIEANIKDALKNLRGKYDYADKPVWEARTIDCSGTNTIISAEEFKIIVAVWGYNGRVTNPAKNYLRAVAQCLPNVNSLFGTSYDSAKIQEWRCKLEWANDNRTILKAIIGSAGELRLYDSQGRVTGLVGGESIQEVPNSIFDKTEESVTVLFPSDSYRYEVVGIEEGTYDLQLALASVNGDIMFRAAEIPISPNAVHRYLIDWYALAQGENGVTVMVDSDGDGVFERTFATGSELTGDEFTLKTETIIDFDPDTLNLKAKGEYVTAYIELPMGYDATQIDISSIRLNGTVPALAKPTQVGDYDRDRIPDLMVKFSRAAVKSLLTPGNQVEITITGQVAGIGFEGSDTICVIKG